MIRVRRRRMLDSSARPGSGRVGIDQRLWLGLVESDATRPGELVIFDDDTTAARWAAIRPDERSRSLVPVRVEGDTDYGAVEVLDGTVEWPTELSAPRVQPSENAHPFPGSLAGAFPGDTPARWDKGGAK